MRASKHSRTNHCGSPSARELASFYFGDEGEDAASAILAGLETEHSLLAGCFKSFLQEAGIKTSQQLAQPQLHQQQQHLAHSRRPQQKLPDTELALQVTLEELYTGAVKCVPVQRQKHDVLGHSVQVQEQLQVCLQPGVKEGTRITLPGFGNQDRQGNLSDLTFVVQQQLHPAFRRLADDLYAIVNVPLVTALTGGPVMLQTLGGQLLQLPVGENDVITPGSELVLPNQGMPVFGDATGRRGALHVRFNVNFPAQLSRQQQQLLRHTLQDCEFNASPQQQLRVSRPGWSAAAADCSTAAAAGAQEQQQQPVFLQLHQQGTQEQQQQQQQRPPSHMHWQLSNSASASFSSSSSSAASAATTAAEAAADPLAAPLRGGGCMKHPAAAPPPAAATAAAAAGSNTSGSAGSSTVAGFACLHSTSSSRVS